MPKTIESFSAFALFCKFLYIYTKIMAIANRYIVPFIFSDQSVFCNNSMWFITVQNKALLAILCSNMGWWLISKYCPRIQNGYQLIWDNFKQISIPSELPPRLGVLADMLMHNVEQNNKED